MVASSASTSATARASLPSDATSRTSDVDTFDPSSSRERRARLHALKLQALVREHTGRTHGELIAAPFALGAALRADGDAWVLVDEATDEGRGLGPALIWASRSNASSLNVVAQRDVGILARRAAEFTLPTTVWAAEGRRLDPVDATPFSSPADPDRDHLRFLGDIRAAGAEPVIEHGVVTGEVRGLEVCRVVDTEGPDGRVVRLEVGAGAHDREAFAIIHGNVPTYEALTGVVAAVAEMRDLDSPVHPLNRLAPERFLRWRLQQEPWLVDLASVNPAPPPVPRRKLTDRTPCCAMGRRLDGTHVVVVCSVGVDLDLIPYVADARLAARGPRALESSRGDDLDVVVALPPRDIVPATTELAHLLRRPVTLVGVGSG